MLRLADLFKIIISRKTGGNVHKQLIRNRIHKQQNSRILLIGKYALVKSV